MAQCECLTAKGVRCSRSVQGKSKYCFQHKTCKKQYIADDNGKKVAIVATAVAVAEPAVTTKVSPSKAQSRLIIDTLQDQPDIILINMILQMNKLNDIKALCASNKRIAKLCQDNWEIQEHLDSILPWDGKDVPKQVIDLITEHTKPIHDKVMETYRSPGMLNLGAIKKFIRSEKNLSNINYIFTALEQIYLSVELLRKRDDKEAKEYLNDFIARYPSLLELLEKYVSIYRIEKLRDEIVSNKVYSSVDLITNVRKWLYNLEELTGDYLHYGYFYMPETEQIKLFLAKA